MWIDVVQIGLAREAEREITAGVCLDISIVTLAGSLKRSVRLWRTSASVSGSVQSGGTTCVRSQIDAYRPRTQQQGDTPIVSCKPQHWPPARPEQIRLPLREGVRTRGLRKFLDNHASRVCRRTNLPLPGLASTVVPSQISAPRRYVAATRARIIRP